MRRAGLLRDYAIAAATVAAVTVATLHWPGTLGLPSAALLLLLPVLLVSARGGIGPSLFAAAAAALAYNFFLLPPQFTLRIHGADNAVSFIVLFAVALVTSRLATALKARERQAQQEAQASAETAKLAALMSGQEDLNAALAKGLVFIEGRQGATRIVSREAMPKDDPAFGPLDLSAAAWAIHNGDMAGHGTNIFPSADWTFLPLGQRGAADVDVVAVARPLQGTRPPPGALRAQVALLAQTRDRLILQEERRERRMLEERDTLRRTLIASLAHDFRSPVTVLRGELEALRLESPAADRALAQAQRLSRKMDDLIGIARIEGGAVRPAPEPVDLVDVVTGALEASGAATAELRIARHVAADLPLVSADPVLLRHVLINLIDNAARHARAMIGIAADEGRGSVVLTVTDDGPGIPEGEEEAIFDRFVRLEGSDRSGGSGLGLAIVKGFCQAMDIDVQASTRASGGACFTLTFPVFGATPS